MSLTPQMFLSLNAYYAVLTAESSNAIQKKDTSVWLSSLSHRHSNQRQLATPDQFHHILSEVKVTCDRTCILNIGIVPSPTFGPYECDAWSITKFIQAISVKCRSKSLQLWLRRVQKEYITVKLVSYQFSLVSFSTSRYAFDLTNVTSIAEVTRNRKMFSCKGLS